MWSAVTRSIFWAAAATPRKILPPPTTTPTWTPAAATSATSAASSFTRSASNAESGAAGQGLAAQFQQDALVSRPFIRASGLAPSLPASTAATSPTLKRTNRAMLMFSPSLAILVLTSWSTRQGGLLDERLLQQADLFVELRHAAFDDLVDHFLRLAFSQRARARDVLLLVEHVRRSRLPCG